MPRIFQHVQKNNTFLGDKIIFGILPYPNGGAVEGKFTQIEVSLGITKPPREWEVRSVFWWGRLVSEHACDQHLVFNACDSRLGMFQFLKIFTPPHQKDNHSCERGKLHEHRKVRFISVLPHFYHAIFCHIFLPFCKPHFAIFYNSLSHVYHILSLVSQSFPAS